MTRTVILIHGAWLSPTAWRGFADRYRQRGYEVLTPTWPGEELTGDQVEQSPEFARLTISKIVDKHEALIRALPDPPILIGHSFGGLFVQMLLDRGLGAAGVAIDPAPAKGVPPSLSALWGALPIFAAWRGWERALTMTPAQFAWGFMHLASSEEQKRAYDRYVIPTPGRLYYQSALGLDGAVRFDNPDRAPLLLIAGEKDRTAAPATVRATLRKYGRSAAVTQFKAFAGRTHLLVATPGWEEIADFAITWAEAHASTSTEAAQLALAI